MPRITEIIEELRFISDRISTQVRTLALGLLAISWAILVGDSTFLHRLSEGLGRSLLLIAALSVLVLLLDFLQYVTAYIYVDKVRREAEAGDLAEIDYPTTSSMRSLRSLFFWAKQSVLVATVVLFLIILARYMYYQAFPKA